MTTLLSKHEATIYTNNLHFPKCDLSDIQGLEHYIFVEEIEFLGETLYNALKADLIDTSGIEPYEAVSFEIGDRVSFEGCYYESIVGSNSSEPFNESNWVMLEKFETACFNELWCNYGLAEYLSRRLLIDSLADSVVTLSGSGLSIKVNNDSVPANKDQIAMYVNSQKGRANRALVRMHNYLIDNKDTCFLGLLTTKCTNVVIGYDGKIEYKSSEMPFKNSGVWTLY